MRNGIAVEREGTVSGSTEMIAIDKVHGIADKIWNRTILKLTVTEVSSDGELLNKPTSTNACAYEVGINPQSFGSRMELKTTFPILKL